MKHSSSREVFAHWNHRRGDRTAPERGEIEPGAIRAVLADTFILGQDDADDCRFRLAGTRVCALFGRELTGEAFVGLWTEETQGAVRALLDAAARERVGVVAGATGDGDRQNRLELLLLPLNYRGRAYPRLLGVLAAMDASYWLAAAPIRHLELGTIRHIVPELETRPLPRLIRRIPQPLRHGLRIYDGGRAE